MPVVSFVMGSGGTKMYADNYGLAQPALMRHLGATAITIDPYFTQATKTSTSVVGSIPHGFQTKVKFTSTTMTVPTVASTLLPLSGVTVYTGTTIYTVGMDYSITATAGKITRLSGRIHSTATVRITCDQYLQALVRAAANAGLRVWLKPMIRLTAGLATTTMLPGATALVTTHLTIAVPTPPTTIISRSTASKPPFTNTMKNKRLVQLGGTAVLANIKLTTYGTKSPTVVITTTSTSTRYAKSWCYIRSVQTAVAGGFSHATLNVTPLAHTAKANAWVITDTAARSYFYDKVGAPTTSATKPTRISWLGIIVWMIQQCQAVGVTPQGVELTTEQPALTAFFETEWRFICTYLRTHFSGIKLVCAVLGSSLTTFNVAHWQTTCDYLGIDNYFTIGVASGASVATMKSNWQTHVTQLETIASTWGAIPTASSKHLGSSPKWMFTELGYHSALASATTSAINLTTTTPQTFTTTSRRTTPTPTNVVVTAGGTQYKTQNGFRVVGKTIYRQGTTIPSLHRSSVTVTWTPPTETTQANAITASVATCWGTSWFAGWHYWEWKTESATTTVGFFLKTSAQIVQRNLLVLGAQFGSVL